MLQGLGRRSVLTAVAALTVMGSAAGCGGATVSKQETADKISQSLEKQVGRRPDSVTCPEDLPAEVGKSVRCELSAGGQKLGVTAKVKSVEGGRAQFDVQVDEK
jgi:hypothetical protein